MKKITLALDWTPNINHIGFFISLHKKFYNKKGLNVEIINPVFDNYEITPAKKIELNIADFALCPTESLISYNFKKKKVNLIGIAVILKKDLSAVVSKKSKNITSPKDLDNKSYASFNARYEELIIKKMITNDGGAGNVKFYHPKKLGVWNTIVNDKYDSTWIFINWEGVQSLKLDTPLRFFKMEDYNIPYSYSPILVGEKENVFKNGYTKSFLQATKMGFEYAFQNKKQALDILKNYLIEDEKNINLSEAYDLTIDSMNHYGKWGYFDKTKVQSFFDWIYNNKIEKKRFMFDDLVTNQFLD